MEPQQGPGQEGGAGAGVLDTSSVRPDMPAGCPGLPLVDLAARVPAVVGVLQQEGAVAENWCFTQVLLVLVVVLMVLVVLVVLLLMINPGEGGQVLLHVDHLQLLLLQGGPGGGAQVLHLLLQPE